MSDVFQFSFNGIAPICILMLAGALLKAVRVLDSGTAADINRLCFRVLIPCKLFIQLYDADITAVTDVPLLALSLGGTAAVIALLCVTVPRFVPRGPRQGEYIQGVFRGNSAILGLPLITNLYGEGAAAVLAVPLPMMLILYNVAAPVILSVYSGGARPAPAAIARKVASNPFLIGVVLGIAVSLSGLRLPAVLVTSVTRMGDAGSTMALVVLGALIDLKSFRRSGRLALSAAVLRLGVLSALVLAVGVLCGLRDERLAVLICFFSTPTAVGGYVLAQNMDGDGELAGQILIVTTLLSAGTLFATIAVLRGMGLM